MGHVSASFEPEATIYLTVQIMSIAVLTSKKMTPKDLTCMSDL